MPALVLSSSARPTKALQSITPARATSNDIHLPSKCTLSPFDLVEICDLIALHLDNHALAMAVRVSSQWYSRWIRHLWRSIAIQGSSSTEILSYLPKLGLHIRKMELGQFCALPLEQTLARVDLSSLNLKSLSLSGCLELDERTLGRLIESSSDQISTLHLRHLSRVRGDVLEVVQSLRHLQQFSLIMDEASPRQRNHSRHNTATEDNSPQQSSKITQFTDANAILAVFDACPRLTMLEIQDLPAAASVWKATTPTATPAPLSLNNPETRPLSPMLHLTQINLHATSISGSTFSAILQRCPELELLNLSQTTLLYLTGVDLESKLRLANLTSLLLSGCQFVDGHGFKEIFLACPKVKHLDLSLTNVDDGALATLGHHCFALEDLNLQKCTHITDQGVRDMLSFPRLSKNTVSSPIVAAHPQPRYQNSTLQCLSLLYCTELTGQGIHHVLTTCIALKSLEFHQPEIMPEGLFPHGLGSDQDQEEDMIEAEAETQPADTLHSQTTAEHASNVSSESLRWACHETLEVLRIKSLNSMNQAQALFLNGRLRELLQLRVLHIGGSQMELSVLDGMGHRLENLYIDDLAREVDLKDVQWLVDHTPNLTRLWCRRLIRHSEPWTVLRGARKQLKLW